MDALQDAIKVTGPCSTIVYFGLPGPEDKLDVYKRQPEDWATIDVDAINAAKAETGIETPTITGAFGDTRDMSSDCLLYTSRCV